jgi:hypothetical protein
MSVKIGVVVMTALLVLYLVFAVQYAVVLIAVGTPIAIGLGVALLFFPLLGAAALVAELVFAVRADRLARRLELEGGLPDDELPALPSGRLERDAADAVFPHYRAAVEADPGDWRGWFRLGLAYDASGDRRRARWATRQAIRRS